MSNTTNLEKSEVFLNQVHTFEKATLTGIEIIKAIGEEGIWIALGVDILLVTGEVTEDNPVLFLQRQAINRLFSDKGFLKLLTKDIVIPFTGVKFPNPIAPMAEIMMAYKVVLHRFRRDDDGKIIFEAADPISRLLLALAIPGIMRLVLKAIPELIPG